MAVKEILDERVIDLDMTAGARDEVVRHLAGFLTEAGYIQDLEGYVKDVCLRGSEGVTGVGNHVVTPCGKSDYIDRVGLMVGHTGDMVEWGSYDGQPSGLFFLFTIPVDSEEAKGHLRLTAGSAGRLGNDSIMTKLQTVKSYDGLLEVFV